MRHFLIASILLSRLLACENTTGLLSNTSSDSAKQAINLPYRDLSITAENAYSDLFLDSLAIEKFIKDKTIDDSTAQGLRQFYNARNFQFAWFNSDGFTEQGLGFWSLHDYTNEKEQAISNYTTELGKRMDTLTENDTLTISPSDSSYITTELALTSQFLNYAAKVKSENKFFEDPYHLVPTKKLSVMEWADSLLNKQKAIDTSLAARPYNLLKDKLYSYYTAAQTGGWTNLPAELKNIKKGKSSPAVPLLKKRLILSGDLGGSDTSQLYNDSLALAIKNYKINNGFDSSYQITDSLLANMNLPVTNRMEQILVNMQRMQWMQSKNQPSMIEVNIPAFMLHVYEGTAKAFDMKVIVGKEGANTMMFSGNLNKIIFSPYWNIPESIVRDEIVPAMKRDPKYLEKNKMEIVKNNDSLPVIRQLPGAKNSLGKVKFLFPNSFDIYFHDTPAKELFQNKQRAFSHGCIRLENAEKMAAYLLKDNKSWTPEKIKKAMNGNQEQTVELSKPVPVSITYYTAWVNENGQLNFRDDVYGHDQKTAQHLFMETAAIDYQAPPDSSKKKGTPIDTGRKS